MLEKIAKNLRDVRHTSPLVHNITNYVVMNSTANALLAIGASPVMAHAYEEMGEMAGIASALVLNIGTLSSEWVDSMLQAGEVAQDRHIPIILDPVGAGATSFRTSTCLQIIEACRPTVIRGNASEIMALLHDTVKTKGVDSQIDSADAVEAAKALARQTDAVVVISGATDYITDGERVGMVNNGSVMMTKVTGLGCTASALTGAFAAVEPDAFQACLSTMTIMGIAGEKAVSISNGPGSLQMNFLDVLYNLTEDDVLSLGKVTVKE